MTTADPTRGLRARSRCRETEQVLLGHGSGGQLSAELLRDVVVPALGSGRRRRPCRRTPPWSAVDGLDLVITTDAFVVSPLFFPGGDIGMLAVHGTVNDLAMMGARATWRSRWRMSSRRDSRSRSCGGSRPRSAPPRRLPGCRSSPATRRWSGAARPTACS